MEQFDFADIMNNMKGLTLGQILRIITKLQYKTVIMIVMFVVTALGGAFVAGRYSHQKDTAVMLESPFSMRIDLKGKTHDFDNLTLMHDPTMPKLADDKAALSLREIRSSFDVVPVGQIIARIEENKLTGIWRLIISERDIISSKAHAQSIPIFNWNSHGNDFNFKEEFVSKNTVHRHYSDGCILKYMVDGNRRSIPSTFKWIRTTHIKGTECTKKLD